LAGLIRPAQPRLSVDWHAPRSDPSVSGQRP
jgi:hypothetical protein